MFLLHAGDLELAGPDSCVVLEAEDTGDDGKSRASTIDGFKVLYVAHQDSSMHLPWTNPTSIGSSTIPPD